MIAEVIPFLRLPSSLPCLDYRVPEDLRITVGSLVKIPFRSRGVYGVVRDKKVTSEIPEGRLSAISRSFGDSPFWGSEFMSVMQNAAEIYHCNPPLLWKTFFPSFPAKITEIFPDPVKKSNKAETKILFGRNNTEERALWYSKFIRDELSNGEQVLLLVPRKAQINELTELLARNGVKDIFSYYGDLGVTAAWEAMSKFRLGRAKVLIGTRMAAALPALNLHTIIIHDEHAEDHKQSDMQPRYDARSIAWLRNFYENAGLILSSPAPRAETVFRARNGTLKPIFWPGEPITPEIINLSHETKKGNYSLFSEILIEKISETLAQNKNILIFENRRGISTIARCRDCGHVFACSSCGLTLTEHFDSLRCHKCNRREEIPLSCPECKSQQINFLGHGTARVERDLRKRYPQAKIVRIDKDTHLNAEILKELLDASIIIGSPFLFTNAVYELEQLKNVSAVTVLLADQLIGRPDWRGNELAFITLRILGLLSVHHKAPFLIQTFSQNHKAIAGLKDQNFFWDSEFKDREAFGYPPFKRLVKIGKIRQNTAKSAPFDISAVRQGLPQVEVQRLEEAKSGKTVWTHLVKIPEPSLANLLALSRCLPPDAIFDVDPSNIT